VGNAVKKKQRPKAERLRRNLCAVGGAPLPLQPPRGFAAHGAGAGRGKRKRFGKGRTERANARSASANVSVLRSRGRLDRPAPVNFGKATAKTKEKPASGRWSESFFQALATSPGLQRGAQVASLHCLILRLAHAYITPGRSFRKGGLLEGRRATRKFPLSSRP